MKKNLLLLAILPMLFLLTGCPYNSKIPLSATPKQPVDKALLGEWKNKKEPNDSSSMKIFDFNANEYSIVIVDKSDNKTTVDFYRAYATPIKGKMLLNMESLKEKGEFSFCSYSVEGDVLKINVVSDVLLTEKYTSSKKMSKAFGEKINSKDFFESELVFNRVVSSLKK